MSNVIKEAASDEHQQLLKALIDTFVSDGLEIVKAAYEPLLAACHQTPCVDV